MTFHKELMSIAKTVVTTSEIRESNLKKEAKSKALDRSGNDDNLDEEFLEQVSPLTEKNLSTSPILISIEVLYQEISQKLKDLFQLNLS